FVSCLVSHGLGNPAVSPMGRRPARPAVTRAGSARGPLAFRLVPDRDSPHQDCLLDPVDSLLAAVLAGVAAGIRLDSAIVDLTAREVDPGVLVAEFVDLLHGQRLDGLPHSCSPLKVKAKAIRGRFSPVSRDAAGHLVLAPAAGSGERVIDPQAADV